MFNLEEQRMEKAVILTGPSVCKRTTYGTNSPLRVSCGCARHCTGIYTVSFKVL